MVDQNNPRFVVVMPVHGRHLQSIECMERLKQTAGYPAKFIAIGGAHDDATLLTMQRLCTVMRSPSASIPYWQAMHMATQSVDDDVYVVNVANDVLPVIHWLTRAADFFRQFPDHVFGFNGDGYTTEHACHFAIRMKRVRDTGGFPQWYHHNYGDTEIITRAIEDGVFHKDPWSILFHNHPIIAGAQNDSVYMMGNKHYERDAELYMKRRSNQWKF